MDRSLVLTLPLPEFLSEYAPAYGDGFPRLWPAVYDQLQHNPLESARVTRLAADMRLYGPEHPVHVTGPHLSDTGQFHPPAVVDGTHRVLAHMMNNQATIAYQFAPPPVVVRDTVWTRCEAPRSGSRNVWEVLASITSFRVRPGVWAERHDMSCDRAGRFTIHWVGVPANDAPLLVAPLVRLAKDAGLEFTRVETSADLSRQPVIGVF